MLIVTRKRNQNVVITLPDGRQVSVGIAEIRGLQVRLAIKAPDDVPVHRLEVSERIKNGEAKP